MEESVDKNHIDSDQPGAWRSKVEMASLPEVFRSIPVPKGGPAWRRLLAFVGPGYLVAVGYMDPGNWSTDIAGGSQFGYLLMSAVLISSLMAVFLQALSAKLGIVTGRDLAQACRDAYSTPTSIMLWLSAEVAIVACDIAEVLGAAIALNLLFNLPLIFGVIITAFDVLIVLGLQSKGFRWIESFVITLIGTMMIIFGLELIYSKPDWHGVMVGLIPAKSVVMDHTKLYAALGILGATVMPHNLYLHSSIVQTRRFGKTRAELKDAIKMATIDSSVALTLAFFINAAILIVAAAVFFRSGHHDIVDIKPAYKLLSPLLGVSIAAPLFAIALLASGQNSTLTGTLAGQIVLEGFLHVKIQPWLRRLISRSIALVPAIGAVWLYGEKGLGDLMNFSQVVLSAQLSFAVVPLIQFTSDKSKMAEFTNGWWTKWVGWGMAAIIAGLNMFLIYQSFFPAAK